MTVCIAALCYENNKSGIVVCSDHRFESYFAGGETGWKLSVIIPGWTAMLSGDTGKAHELIATYREYLSREDAFALTEHNVTAELKRPVELFKTRLIEDFIRLQIGMSYEEFLRNSSTLGNVFVEMMYQIRTITLGCSIILAGFIAAKPYIFCVSEDGSVNRHNPFASIGSGGIIASAMLYKRNYMERCRVPTALYCVYEAKKMSESAPGVGKTTNLCVLFQPSRDDASIRFVDNYEWLDQKYGELSPRPVPDLELPPGVLTDAGTVARTVQLETGNEQKDIPETATGDGREEGQE